MRGKKQLKSFLNSLNYNDEYFSRSAVISAIRALLEPVASQNVVSVLFSRIKNKDGLEGLIKRLEYCNNVEMTDITNRDLLIKDDYIELEFIIFTSPRYNFALIWDFSQDTEKNYTKLFFLINSKNVNDVFEVLQSNMTVDFREKFYLHKPERRENELMNEAVFNIIKKVNTQAQEGVYGSGDDFILDLSQEDNEEDKIKEIRHEIKNQLSILDIYTKLIEKQNGKSKYIDIIKKSLSLIMLSANELGNYENCGINEINIHDVIEEAVLINEEILKVNNNKISFTCQHGYDVKIFANETRLLSVLNNIIKNANESTTNDTIIINLDTNNNCVILQIVNHGEPVAEGVQKHIFEKGYTTKKKGYGIGLYFCKNYIKELGGKLELEKSDSKETIFKILLPLI